MDIIILAIIAIALIVWVSDKGIEAQREAKWLREELTKASRREWRWYQEAQRAQGTNAWLMGEVSKLSQERYRLSALSRGMEAANDRLRLEVSFLRDELREAEAEIERLGGKKIYF